MDPSLRGAAAVTSHTVHTGEREGREPDRPTGRQVFHTHLVAGSIPVSGTTPTQGSSMQFYVMSRSRIEEVELPNVPHLVVSISTPDAEPARIDANASTLNIVRLWFHDLCDEAMKHVEVRDEYEARCFSREHAREVLDAVAANPSAQCIIVHCDAGLSRSPAVAAALSKILTGDDAGFFKRYHPNSRVYRTILEEHHFRGDDHGDDHH